MVDVSQRQSSIADYTILSLIGKGAFSDIKKAKNNITGAIVAIKFIYKKKYKRNTFLYLNEIEILKHLAKDGCKRTILCFIEAFEDNDIYYLVTEYVEGQSLTTYIKTGSLTEKEEISLIVQIAEAILYLHQAGIAHRDLKTDNILVYSTNSHVLIKIIDFGFACNVFSLSARCTSVILGTPRYLAPEVLQKRVIDARTPDVFALACIFYFISTGTFLFDAPSLSELYEHILANNHNTLDNLDVNLQNIIEKMILLQEDRPKMRDIMFSIWALETTI